MKWLPHDHVNLIKPDMRFQNAIYFWVLRLGVYLRSVRYVYIKYDICSWEEKFYCTHVSYYMYHSIDRKVRLIPVSLLCEFFGTKRILFSLMWCPRLLLILFWSDWLMSAILLHFWQQWNNLTLWNISNKVVSSKLRSMSAERKI